MTLGLTADVGLVEVLGIVELLCKLFMTGNHFADGISEEGVDFDVVEPGGTARD